MSGRTWKILETTQAKVRRLKKEGVPKWVLMERFGLTVSELELILRKKERGENHAE